MCRHYLTPFLKLIIFNTLCGSVAASNLKMPPVEKGPEIGEEVLPPKKPSRVPSEEKMNSSPKMEERKEELPKSPQETHEVPNSKGEAAPTSPHSETPSLEENKTHDPSQPLTSSSHDAALPKGNGLIWFAIVFVVLMVVIFAFT